MFRQTGLLTATRPLIVCRYKLKILSPQFPGCITWITQKILGQYILHYYPTFNNGRWCSFRVHQPSLVRGDCMCLSGYWSLGQSPALLSNPHILAPWHCSGWEFPNKIHPPWGPNLAAFTFKSLLFTFHPSWSWMKFYYLLLKVLLLKLLNTNFTIVALYIIYNYDKVIFTITEQ